ncbi:hypothetical protein K435DRAFT_808055 [Dendrothele bispora CBS 962.96]|uniref:Uncharacterized protein n=1 Tax=Dendrothele bispora (strain CBS 962.96) TaxID=1314807 RepID=A0A4S8L2S2_DENBC|nr:hypothetical protein K435DRAFT_808055 [Dendrothele bispora CBS 962.96]
MTPHQAVGDVWGEEDGKDNRIKGVTLYPEATMKVPSLGHRAVGRIIEEKTSSRGEPDTDGEKLRKGKMMDNSPDKHSTRTRTDNPACAESPESSVRTIILCGPTHPSEKEKITPIVTAPKLIASQQLGQQYNQPMDKVFLFHKSDEPVFQRTCTLLNGATLPTLSRSLFRDGQLYYLKYSISLLTGSTAFVMLVVPSLDIQYKVAYIPLHITFTNIIACWVFRNVKLGRIRESEISALIVASQLSFKQGERECLSLVLEICKSTRGVERAYWPKNKAKIHCDYCYLFLLPSRKIEKDSG